MDYQQIKALMKDFEASSLTEFALEFENMKLHMSKAGKAALVNEVVLQEVKQVESKTVEEPKKVSDVFMVKSQLVGTFYQAASQKDKPFVVVGQTVKKGYPICIIEAMKIMNEIQSPVSGVIESIFVNNGDAVGFEQVLVSIADAK